jgi:hypothetical protein
MLNLLRDKIQAEIESLEETGRRLGSCNPRDNIARKLTLVWVLEQIKEIEKSPTDAPPVPKDENTGDTGVNDCQPK